jgi:hypothetical protein
MKQFNSKFKIYEEQTTHKQWSNYASENVLLQNYNKVHPVTDLTGPVMEYLTTNKPSLAGKKTPLQDWLQTTGRIRTISTDDFTWKMRGTSQIKSKSMENLNPGVDCPGIQNTEFPIKLDVEWFVTGDRLAVDIRKDVLVIVRGLPIADGTGYIYNVVINDTDGRTYFPPELLEPNLNWIKIDSIYGEASLDYGSFYMAPSESWLQFKGSITDYGKAVEVTNKAHSLNLKMVSCDAKGMETDTYPAQIISLIEAEFISQAKWEKELGIYFGRALGNQVIDKSSGYKIRAGAGLLEYLEDGNVIPYPMNGGSISMFVEYLQQIWFDRIPISERKVKIYTGTGGLGLWNNWLKAEYAVTPIMAKYDDYIGKGESFGPNSGPALSLKNPYFNGYQSFPFGQISVEYWPILDSTFLNGNVLHPETGLPVSSYDFIIMDVGTGTGLDGSNIELLKRENHEVFTYICGVWSPAGPINGVNTKGYVATHPGRSYKLTHTDSYGIRVKDVSNTALFTMDIV